MAAAPPSAGSPLAWEASQALVLRWDDVLTEFEDWRSRYPDDGSEHPDPRSQGGLPSSWTLIDHRNGPLDGDTGVLFGLARRDAGGWILLYHLPQPHSTHLNETARSIPDLWLLVQDDPPFAEFLRDVIVAAYDPADPVEAGERTLVALGGPIVLSPRSLESR